MYLADIAISLTVSTILVGEGDASVEIDIVALGFPDDPFAFRVPVEAFILLYTGDGSAQG